MLTQSVAPHVKDMPPLEGFMTVPMAVEIRFQKWDQILSMPQPDPSMQAVTVFWHFARGAALAGKGKIPDAEAEYRTVSPADAATPPDALFQMPINNKAKDILTLAQNVQAHKRGVAKQHR